MKRGAIALALAACLAVLLATAAQAGERLTLRDGQRVLFLGDSITYAGMYAEYVEAYLLTRFPKRRFELLNLGLPSENVTGLSEPDHPYPRPNVHERLARALAKVKPDVVVACYGMNDGIYYPFSEERFSAYQAGIRRVVAECRAAGAKVVLMTPPPFDARPVRNRVLPAGAPKYSWMTPYAEYDTVLARYAEWLLTLRGRGGLAVVDTRGAINRHLAALRASDPGYQLAGDGVHMDAAGHWLIAAELLRALGAPAEVDRAAIDARAAKARRGRVSDLAADRGGVRFTWLTRLPMPMDPRWDRRLGETERIGERFNRHRLVVTGLPQGRYELFEGDRKFGEATGAELAAGVNLLRYPDLSTNRRSAELLKLVQERAKLVNGAWLTDVGHQRPDTPRGLPLEEARRRAEPLDAQIRRLAQPVTLALRVSPTR